MSGLAVRGLVKSYGARRVVDGVDLDLAPGAVLGLLGPNGAGKSTCFKMIAGLLRPDAGSVRLDGRDISAMPLHLRARAGLGYLPQEASVFRTLGVRQNIEAALQQRGDLDRAGRAAAADELLAEFGLVKQSAQPGASLSGGQRRRLEIARALALSPSVLMLDEPFAGVDPIAVQDIREQVMRLKARDIGVLITDHSVRDALGMCDHAIIISEGRAVARGSADEVVANPLVRKSYLGDNFRL